MLDTYIKHNFYVQGIWVYIVLTNNKAHLIMVNNLISQEGSL